MISVSHTCPQTWIYNSTNNPTRLKNNSPANTAGCSPAPSTQIPISPSLIQAGLTPVTYFTMALTFKASNSHREGLGSSSHISFLTDTISTEKLFLALKTTWFEESRFGRKRPHSSQSLVHRVFGCFPAQRLKLLGSLIQLTPSSLLSFTSPLLH